MILCLALIVASLVNHSRVSASEVTRYKITDLGEFREAYDLNNLGQIVGRRWDNLAPGESHATLWEPNALSPIDLGDLPGSLDFSLAYNVNDKSNVVGFSYTDNELGYSAVRAFLWTAADGMRDLGDLPGGFDYSRGYGINNLNQIVGSSSVTDYAYHHAVLWDPQANYQPIDLGTLAPYDTSVALAINDNGVIVGVSAFGNKDHGAAVVWKGGAGLTALPSLPDCLENRASSVNNRNQIVGSCLYTTGWPSLYRAVFWGSDSSPIDIGDLPGGYDSSLAYAINESGQVVGASSVENGDLHAFIWEENIGIQDLNDLIDPNEPLLGTFVLQVATGINDKGQIIGYGEHDGKQHGFLLTPLPSPPPTDRFTWPVDPQNPSSGHYGRCREWGKKPDGCYWLSDTSEDRSTVWIDVQPFQRYKWQGHGFHLGADYNFGQEPSDKGKPVYPTAKGFIPLGGVKTNQCGFGNIIFVRHDTSFGTYTSMYAHVDWLTSGPPKEGDQVSSDSPIAIVGNGSWNNRSCKKQKKGSWPYHLHFELREGDNITNGIAYTPYQMDKGPQGQIDPDAFISSHH